MKEETYYLTAKQEKQLAKICETLWLNTSNLAYILGLSRWYMSKIMVSKRMSKRVLCLLSLLINYLEQEIDKDTIPSFRHAMHESIADYRHRQKTQLDTLKSKFFKYSQKYN